MLIYNPKCEEITAPATVVEAEAKVITVVGDDHGCTIQIVSFDGIVKTIYVMPGENVCVVE